MGVKKKSLHTHFHGNARVRSIALNHEIRINEIFDVINLISCPPQLRKRSRFPFKLLLECIDVIPIDMSVSKLDNKFVGFGASYACDHVREQRIGSNIEWYSEP